MTKTRSGPAANVADDSAAINEPGAAQLGAADRGAADRGAADRGAADRGTADRVRARIDHALTRDGISLLVRAWPVRSGEPWATMLLVHGIAEHCGRYEHVGAQLAEAGIEAHGFDLRGFGGSGGPRASVDRWSQLHDDVEERMVAARSIAPGRPLVLYGHSMGGLIALGYVLDGRARPDLLVLSAPAIGAEVPLWQRLVAGPLNRLAPRLLIANKLDTRLLSSDPEVCEAYVSDPLNQHKTTVRFGHALFAEQRRVVADLDRLSIPTLVIHGALDRLVPTASSEALDDRPGVVRRVYAGMLHELHNEPEGARVVSDVVDWIRDRVSRMPAPAAG